MESSATTYRRAVDTPHHLIVAHEVTNVGSDRDQLSSMAKQAREAMASQTLAVVADRGYFKGEEILACYDANITAYVPKPMTSGAKADGRFNKDAFVYDATRNEYICPAGEALIWRFSSVEKGMNMHCYWSSNCQSCALKTLCTPSKQRRVRRCRRSVPYSCRRPCRCDHERNGNQRSKASASGINRGSG